MRLDRAICNSEWVQEFPQCEVDHLAKVLSDHRPFLIHLGFRQSPSPSPKTFRFLASWISHPGFSQLIERTWNDECGLLNCIANSTVEIQKWNDATFGAIGKRKHRLLNRIQGIQSKLEDPDNTFADSLSNLEMSLKEELEEVCFQEELLWLQKSSSEWICLGDRNTHYYHLKALIRRRRNRISQLKNHDGLWLTNDECQAAHVRQFFKELYSLEDPIASPLSSRGMFPTLADSQLMAMTRVVTLEEVYSGILVW
ncbi:hypothetical protein K1719_031281 [Acacia pycnantha]|nr:hypothetical protein K1719_031281 [Acacia pycnantha]